MKNTLKQIFHDKKFIMGFIIFIAILATIIIYPLVVAYSPLEMVGGLYATTISRGLYATTKG